MGWQEEAMKRREEATEWCKVGAASEREELIDILLTDRSVIEVAQVVDLLMKRQRESGVVVHRCKASDMEPR